jgi:hypothetical protein
MSQNTSHATTTSFARDVKPLFRPIDVNHMLPFGVALNDFGYMGDPAGDHGNAGRVFARLKGTEVPRMPPGGPFWTDDMLSTYERWMADGFQP